VNTKQAATAAIRRVEYELRIIRAQSEYDRWQPPSEAEHQARFLKEIQDVARRASNQARQILGEDYR
jgi:hypothetical protein